MLFQDKKKMPLHVDSINFICFKFIFTLSGQNITVEQDAKFEQLLNEKRKVNASIAMNDMENSNFHRG
jgi:hypothetical protein